jgi:glycosyltransferase involved in cell wall biosynthesis
MLPSWYPSPYNPLRGSFFRLQAQALHKAGCNIGVIYPEVATLRNLRPSRMREYRFQYEFKLDEGVPTLKYFGWYLYAGLPLHEKYWEGTAVKLYRRYVKERGKPDLVFAQGTLWGGIAARSINKATGCPYVIMEHSSAFLKGNVSEKSHGLAVAALTDAKEVMCVSNALAEAVIKGGYIEDRRPEVVPNMVDTDFFIRPPQSRKYEPFVFVAVGALIESKGVDILLRAYAHTFKGQDDVRLVVVGDGPQRGALEALSQELGIAAQVEWHGNLDREGLLKALWQASAFVHPSFVETFGIVLIEAMATGLPLVVTDCGGPAGIIGESTGIMVTPKDVDALAAAMKTMRDKASKYDPATIREEVVHRYSEEVVTNQIMQIFASALA